jgi:hypothetical protein
MKRLRKEIVWAAGDLGFSLLETNSKGNGIPIEVEEDKKTSTQTLKL